MAWKGEASRRCSVRDDQHRAAVAQNEVPARGRIRRIDGNERAARQHHGQLGDHEIQPARQTERDMLSGYRLPGFEKCRQARCL
jgi:hypothetical protein